MHSLINVMENVRSSTRSMLCLHDPISQVCHIWLLQDIAHDVHKSTLHCTCSSVANADLKALIDSEVDGPIGQQSQ